MKQSNFEKIKLFFRQIIIKFTNHKYGCCDDIFKNCNKCDGF